MLVIISMLPWGYGRWTEEKSQELLDSLILESGGEAGRSLGVIGRPVCKTDELQA